MSAVQVFSKRKGKRRNCLQWQLEFLVEHNYLKQFKTGPPKVGWLYEGLTPLKQLRSYHGGR